MTQAYIVDAELNPLCFAGVPSWRSLCRACATLQRPPTSPSALWASPQRSPMQPTWLTGLASARRCSLLCPFPGFVPDTMRDVHLPFVSVESQLSLITAFITAHISMNLDTLQC